MTNRAVITETPSWYTGTEQDFGAWDGMTAVASIYEMKRHVFLATDRGEAGTI